MRRHIFLPKQIMFTERLPFWNLTGLSSKEKPSKNCIYVARSDCWHYLYKISSISDHLLLSTIRRCPTHFLLTLSKDWQMNWLLSVVDFRPSLQVVASKPRIRHPPQVIQLTQVVSFAVEARLALATRQRTRSCILQQRGRHQMRGEHWANSLQSNPWLNWIPIVLIKTGQP